MTPSLRMPFFSRPEKVGAALEGKIHFLSHPVGWKRWGEGDENKEREKRKKKKEKNVMFVFYVFVTCLMYWVCCSRVEIITKRYDTHRFACSCSFAM